MSHAPDLRGLSSYELVAVIGRGGMADVFLAMRRDIGALDRKVVIKQLRADVAEDEEFRAMFVDEARLARRLVHANVVRTFEAGREGSRCFIVMEFLDGQPFSRIQNRAKSEGRLPLCVQLRILSEALTGLEYVHELADVDGAPLGIVHRDVTPHNVFVCYDGRVKVVDFGIAKAAARLAETKIGVVKGKLAYMAPEHLRGAAVDRRSDIFSVGVMLWEAAAGRRYWEGYEELTIYRRLLAGDLPELGARAPIHPRLVPILERALAVDVERRYRTAGEMREELDAALRDIAPHVGSGDVAASVCELFARERTAFHDAIRRAQMRPRVGEPSTPEIGLLGQPENSLFTDDDKTRIWQGKPTLQSRTTLSGAVGVTGIDDIEDAVDFRAGSRLPRTLGWLLVAGGVGFAAASSLVKPSTTLPSPPQAAVAKRGPAAMTTETPLLQAPATKAAVAVSALAKVTTPPAATLARGWRPGPPSVHTRSLVAKPAPTVFDDLPTAPLPHRALDKDDPWSD